MRRLLLGLALAAGGAAGAAAAVLLMGGGQRVVPPGSAGRAAVEAAIEPRAHLFGDPVSARVDVLVERGRVDPGEPRLEARFEPYEPIAPVRTERRDAGGLMHLRFVVELRCLGAECVPQSATRAFAFPPASVVAGGSELAEVRWPEVEVTSRLPANAAREGAPAWRANMTELPPVSYLLAPRTAAAALAGLAGALAAVACLLLAGALRRRPAGPPPLPPLERALLLLAAARRTADPEEERKALDLLAAELARGGEGGLAREASELAWARPLPAAAATDTLSRRVARLVEQARNGHGP